MDAVSEVFAFYSELFTSDDDTVESQIYEASMTTLSFQMGMRKQHSEDAKESNMEIPSAESSQRGPVVQPEKEVQELQAPQAPQAITACTAAANSRATVGIFV